MKILISETTMEERRQIVADSLAGMDECDACMPGLAEMYDEYIYGNKELRDINMEFQCTYVADDDMPGRSSCVM